MDVNELERRINRLGNESFHIQTQAISALVGEVKGYVQRIHEEEEIVNNMSSMRDKIRNLEQTKPDDDDADKNKAEVQKVKATYNDAVRIKRLIGVKKSELRRLKSELDQIRTEISRVVN